MVLRRLAFSTPVRSWQYKKRVVGKRWGNGHISKIARQGTWLNLSSVILGTGERGEERKRTGTGDGITQFIALLTHAHLKAPIGWHECRAATLTHQNRKGNLVNGHRKSMLRLRKRNA
jgi:hypothetical protein